jgi:hypothetical protein
MKCHIYHRLSSYFHEIAMKYPAVFKHYLLENPPFSPMFFSAINLHLVGGFAS